ncbi:hypothetical protein [Rhodanobacter fulvus]|nr:hypothetical protein [Rhodanobacter fulvus]
MKMIETFLASLWRNEERSCLVDNRSQERPATLPLHGCVRGVEGAAK